MHAAMQHGPRIGIQVAETPDPRRYRVAGHDVWSDAPWSALAAFEEPMAPGEPHGPRRDARGETGVRRAPRGPDTGARVVHDASAWLAGRWRHVHGTVTAAGYRLLIDGMDPLTVTSDEHGLVIRHTALRAIPEPALLEEAVLGPALLLALAQQGTFALHASAIELDGRAYAFLGRSGVGKSTLVRPPHDLGHRIADDIVPVSWDDERGALAWPRYPQLKVGRLGSEARPLVERLPLGGLFLLDGPTSTAQPASATVVPALPATIAVARHTVAARLFAPALLRRQLAFAAALTRQVPVMRLGYARRHDALPSVRRLIAARARAVAGRGRAHVDSTNTTNSSNRLSGASSP